MNYLAHYERTITCASRYIYPRKSDIGVRKEDEEREREREKERERESKSELRLVLSVYVS